MDRVKTYLLILFFLTAIWVHADTTSKSGFEVDWEHMELRVYGSSQIIPQDSGNMIDWQLKAAYDAEQKLLRNFIDALKYIQVDGYRTAHVVVKNDLEKNQQIYRYCDRIRARSIIYDDKSVAVEKVFPFYGRDGFIPILFRAGRDTDNFPENTVYVFSTVFSGLVIDARGLNRRPAVSPRIFDQEHKLIYSADLMERDHFNEWGAVQYVTDPKDLRIQQRFRVNSFSGEEPFRIVAIPDDRLLVTDIMIFTEDAQILLNHLDTRSNLRQGRVVVILDSLENKH